MQEGTWQDMALVQCKLWKGTHKLSMSGCSYRQKVSWDRSCVLFAGQTDDIVLLYFSKAFDKVSHHLLLTKLQHYGIRGNALNWISDFYFYALNVSYVHEGSSSKLTDVTSGVLQGSVLEPLLFLSYNLLSLCRLFADDCILYRDIKSAEDAWIFQEDLNKLAIRVNTWGMQFNIDKCQSIKSRLKTQPLNNWILPAKPKTYYHY